MKTTTSETTITNPIAGRYYPADAIEIIQDDIVIYTYEKVDGKPCAVGYGGRRKKSDFHYNFKTEERREEYIAEYLTAKANAKAAREQDKIDKKAKAKKELAQIEVGDIFHEGGGYEQTNCYFYELIEFKGATGTFRQIASQTVPGSEGMMCEQRLAITGEFVGAPFKKRLSGKNFKVSYNYAYKVENPKTESFYCSWYA